MIFALLFEINGIQQYLFASGRLRDVIGASELLDLLTNEGDQSNLLDAVKNQVPSGNDIQFSRRAGGAFYAFCSESGPLKQFLALWTLVVQQWAPDISYNIGFGLGEAHPEAFQNARDGLRNDQSRQRPYIPVAVQVAERSQRTGNVAVTRSSRDGTIDAATRRKKAFADTSRAGFIGRFSPEDCSLGWRDWPLDMDAAEDDAKQFRSFPFLGEDRTVALIHADGNGLGQILLNINKAVKTHPEIFMDAYQQLSKLIEKSGIYAAQQATREVLVPARDEGRPLPARPILLGGEDMIVIVRADIALDYINVFARAFEEESRRQLKQMARLGIDLPKRLTMGFGAVFLRANQPFHMGISLAEELMAQGKNAAKSLDAENPAATLQFQRITASLVDDYETILERQLTHRDGKILYCDTLGAYYLDDATLGPYESSNSAPRLADLRDLAELLGSPGMARGPTRQLLTLIGLSPTEARARYRRWRQLMKENNQAQLNRFDGLMARLLQVEELSEDLPYGPAKDLSRGGDQYDPEEIRFSPLADALAIAHMSRVSGAQKRAGEDAA